MSTGTTTAAAVPSGAAAAVVPSRVDPGPVDPASAHPAPVQRTVLGVDTDRADTLDVDHLVAGLADRLPAGAVVCTHLVRDDRPHVAVSVDVPGRLGSSARAAVAAVFGSCPLVVELLADEGVAIAGDGDVPGGARLAASEALTGTGGRAVLYPGCDALTGELTVGDLLARSGVDRVVDLTGSGVDPTVLVWTRDFVRPLRSGNRLELSVQPAADDRVVPFEDPDPTPCCAVHARKPF